MCNLTFSIGEVARRAEVPASTIRYYEKIGLLPTPDRQNGQRLYAETIFTRLKTIKMAQRLGWPLAEIKKSMAHFDDHTAMTRIWKAQIPSRIADLDKLIAQAKRIRATLETGLDCNCRSLPDCTLLAEHIDA